MKYLLLIAMLLSMGCAKKPAKLTITPADVPEQIPDQNETMYELADDESQPELIRLDLDIPPIYFDFDSYEIRDINQVKRAASYFVENNVSIVLEGHTCEIGTEKYNFSLGEKRAQAVRQVLYGFNCPPERVTIISYGEGRPASSDRSLNRRVEFNIKK